MSYACETNRVHESAHENVAFISHKESPDDPVTEPGNLGVGMQVLKNGYAPGTLQSVQVRGGCLERVVFRERVNAVAVDFGGGGNGGRGSDKFRYLKTLTSEAGRFRPDLNFPTDLLRHVCSKHYKAQSRERSGKHTAWHRPEGRAAGDGDPPPGREMLPLRLRNWALKNPGAKLFTSPRPPCFVAFTMPARL